MSASALIRRCWDSTAGRCKFCGRRCMIESDFVTHVAEWHSGALGVLDLRDLVKELMRLYCVANGEYEQALKWES